MKLSPAALCDAIETWTNQRQKMQNCGDGFGNSSSVDKLEDMPSIFLDADPRELRLPSSRFAGADPLKLQRQIARFGAFAVGMPRLWVNEATDGVLVIADGVTRATRIAKLAPGTLVPVEVIGKIHRPCHSHPKIGDHLP